MTTKFPKASALALAIFIARVSNAADIPTDTGIHNGLCVTITSRAQPSSLQPLTHKGDMLVQNLALDATTIAPARADVTSKGLYGLITIDAYDGGRLPYANNLVNLLLIDRDDLGAKAPAEEEALRVVAPYGVLCQRVGGKWTLTKKPRPAAFDDWGHFDHGADGNSVSHDKAVKQPTQLQWTSGLQWIQPAGNPAAYATPAGVRIIGRYAVIDWTHDVEKPTDKPQKACIQCRDAFSGIPLWTIDRSPGVGRHRWSFIAAGDCLYTYLKADEDIVAIDLATGKILRTFPGSAATKPGDKSSLADERIWIRVEGDALLVNLGSDLKCFDTATGTLRWTFTEPNCEVLLPTLDGKKGRVYIATAGPAIKFASRWPWAATQKVMAIDIATGHALWRCEDIADKPVGQLVPAGDYLVAFGSAAIGGGDKGFIGSIKGEGPDAGKLTSEAGFEKLRNYNVAMYNALYRDGLIYFAGAFSNIWSFDPRNGQMQKVWSTGYNQRCTRFNATDDWFIWGYVTYLDKNFEGTLQSVTRSGCAIGSIPANGMMYFTPSACGCFTQTRGYQAYTPEPLRPPLADDLRLTSGAASSSTTVTAPSTLPEGSVAPDWPRQVRTQQLETAPTISGDLRYTAIIHQHRIECRDAAGKLRWSAILGGRVTQSPLVKDGIAFAGAHDGRVYALDAQTGALRWSYLLAPSLRNITAFGQLENSWPVFGICEVEGTIVASAGTHPEIGGGVVVAGFDPSTGKPLWKKTLTKSVATLTVLNGKTQGAIVPNGFLNDIPAVEDGKIILRASTTGGSFAFLPTESEEDLNKRLNTPPPKKVPLKKPAATQPQAPAK